jgi:citrate synthase
MSLEKMSLTPEQELKLKNGSNSGIVCEYQPGLAGIQAAESAVSFIDGAQGILEYRGISIEELAAKSTFIEIAYLLIEGKLPNRAELEEFETEIRYHRRIKYRIRDMMKCFPETGHPMDALQASAAALGLFYSRRALNDPVYIREASIRLLAKIPTMVAAFQLMRKGNDPIQPNDNLDYSANFLYMLTEKVPSEAEAKILDRCLILHAEHTMNASTFSARVTASTLTDPYAVVASAVGTLAGPLHGGANEDVLEMLEEIGTKNNVHNYVCQCLEKDPKYKFPGFGHRVWKIKDPRATVLQKCVEDLFEEKGSDEFYDVAVELEKIIPQELARLGRTIVYPNVDYFSGLVYRKLGIPNDLFTPIFAIARVAGWLAHWKEQLAVNKIYRPTQRYVGLHQQPYISIDER